MIESEEHPFDVLKTIMHRLGGYLLVNRSFELLGSHDYVEVYYVENDDLTFEERNNRLKIFAPIDFLEDIIRKGLSVYEITTLLLGHKKRIVENDVLSSVLDFDRIYCAYSKFMESLKAPPAYIFDFIEDYEIDVDDLSTAYYEIVAYATWLFLYRYRQSSISKMILDLNIIARFIRDGYRNIDGYLEYFKDVFSENEIKAISKLILERKDTYDARKTLEILRKIYSDQKLPTVDLNLKENTFGNLFILYTSFCIYYEQEIYV
jgi:hypothetical protein